jgi:hypothetical protein
MQGRSQENTGSGSRLVLWDLIRKQSTLENIALRIHVISMAWPSLEAGVPREYTTVRAVVVW